MFPQLLNAVADIIAPKINIIFHRLIRLGSFPESWRSADVTAIPKGAPSPDSENYRPISIIPFLSKVYEKLVPHKLSSFCDKCVFFGLLLLLSFIIGKVWAALMHCLPYHLQTSLDAGIESYIVQLDFCAAFDTMNYSGL